MTYIYAGTAYNQVIAFASDDKKKQKKIYGPMAREIVNFVSLDFNENRMFYSTSRHINLALESGETTCIAETAKETKIIDIEYDHQSSDLRYVLSDGGIHSVSPPLQGEDKPQCVVMYKGQGPNKYVGSVAKKNNEEYLIYGKGIIPYIANLPNGVASWKGKNVKHDELDLQVPIDDIDASFIRDDKFHVILNAHNKLRLFDIRGSNRRPCSDIALKGTAKSRMTCMEISKCENNYYFSNDIGEIFHCDSRKNWDVVGKYKGIASTVTDIAVSCKHLVSTSLDCYVRVYDINTRELLSKFYMNKPVHSLFVLFNDEGEVEKKEFQEEEIDLAEEEVETKKTHKMKQIRKRNKIGLKYLEPREFDDVEVKKEDIKKEAWYEKLNPVDRRDFQQNP